MNETQPESRNDWASVHALALFVLIGTASLVPTFRVWPLLWVVPLAAYAALVWLVPPLRTSFRPWRIGRITGFTVLAAATIAIGSSAILVGFHSLQHPDVRAHADFLPVASLGGIVFAGILFSVLNALSEEVVFRGVLFDAVDAKWGDKVAVVATALLFGFSHMSGYPPGLVGAILATAFGLCLGWLRVCSSGIGLGFLVHIAADATIYILVVNSGVF